MGSAPKEDKGRGSLKFRSCNSSLITKQLCVAWPGPSGDHGWELGSGG